MDAINLLFRFLLEVAALLALGLWASSLVDGVLVYVSAIGLPLLAAIFWGTFAVPGDPSRSGNAPVAVSGKIRLFIELIFFVAAVWSLYDLTMKNYAAILGLLVIVHYACAHERVSWLLRN